MKGLLILLFLAFFCQAEAAHRAVFIDVDVFIKVSTKRYKEGLGNNFRDTKTKNYYYYPEAARSGFEALDAHTNSDIFLYSHRRKKSFDKKYSRKLGISGVLFTDGEDFNPANFPSLAAYSEYKFIGYNPTRVAEELRGHFIDLGERKYSFLSTKDANRSFKRLDRDSKNRYNDDVSNYFLQGVGPIEREQKKLAFYIMDFIYQTELAGKADIDQEALGEVFLSDVLRDVDYRRETNVVTIDGNDFQKAGQCMAFFNDGTSVVKEDSFCPGETVEYQWIVEGGRVTRCFKSSEEGLGDEVSLGLCASQLGVQAKWIYDDDNQKVLSCERRTIEGVLFKSYSVDECIDFMPSNVSFQVDADQFVTGCFLSDQAKGYSIRSLDPKSCQNHASLSLQWEFDADQTKVLSCQKVDANTSYKFRDVSLDDCIQKFGVRHYFEHTETHATGCNMVTEQNQVVIQKMDSLEKCIEYTGITYGFDSKDGVVTGCYQKSKYRNLTLSRMDNYDECIKLHASKIVNDFLYSEDKTQVIGCTARLVTGETLPEMKAESCLSKKMLLRDDNLRYIKGCFDVVPSSGTILNREDISECVSDTSNLKPKYLKKDQSLEVEGCYLTDAKMGLPIKDLSRPLDTCRAETESVFLYRGLDKKECLEFYQDSQQYLIKIGPAELSRCEVSPLHVLYDKEVENYFFLSGELIDSSLSYEEHIEQFAPLPIKLAKSLAKDFEDYLITTKRKLTVFNYRKRSLVTSGELVLNQTGTTLMNSKVVLDYTKEWMQAFWNFLPGEGGQVGWGLYAANNPIQSFDYGSTYWAQVGIDIPAGSKLLDLRAFEDQIPMSQASYDLASESGGMGGRRWNADLISVEKTILTQFLTNHKALNMAFKKLQINAMVYYWSSNYDYHSSRFPAICDSNQLNGTFVIVDNPLDKNTVRLVVKEGATSANAEELEWYSKVNSLFHEFGFSSAISASKVKLYTKEEQDYLDWRNESLFTCSSTFSEDSMIQQASE